MPLVEMDALPALFPSLWRCGFYTRVQPGYDHLRCRSRP